MSKFQVTKGIINNLNNVPYTEGQVYFVYNDINSENLDIYADIDGVRRKIESKSGYELPPATTSTLGGVKIGDGLSVAADGTASVSDGGVTTDKLAQDVREAINISSAADALMGDPSESTWSRRTSTGSGMARVESVQGAAVVWNQLNKPNPRSVTSKGVTFTITSDGKVTLDGTATGAESFTSSYAFGVVSGHKYVYRGADVARAVYANVTGIGYNLNSDNIYTATSDAAHVTTLSVTVAATYTGTYECYPQLFDLTAMFGAGNEPATVAEFEAMFPEPYYPYSEPTLKPVQIAGIQSTDAQGNALDGVEWPTQTLRAAGSIRDELTAGELVTRVGVVDLGTLTWIYNSQWNCFAGNIGAVAPKAKQLFSGTCAKYPFVGSYQRLTDKSSGYIYNTYACVRDTDYGTDPNAFKAAVSGVLLYYELETSTTTPISPALPMNYRVEQGGTESIVVPEGEISAAPVLTVAEGESAADVVMDALACIATPDGPTATANHAANTYLTMSGKLYKVTRAIAVGEQITPGTNVTETTVMAELIARTA